MIEHEPPCYQMWRDFISNPDIKVAPFAADVGQPVEKVEAHAELWILFGQTH
jgi:hypothetical protein